MNGAEIAPLLAAAAREDEAGFLGQGARLASAGGDAVSGWRGIALALNAAGQPAWAARAQRQTVRAGRDTPGLRLDDEAFLGDLLLRAGDLNG
ncbi:MAG: hypothetical protein O3B22_17675, partial [Proteobacteria bacterium]|nr:hypothetical protein [Pseudomonadota bacterium]